jgi:DNA polymerase III sliding clamp (beta) subunit (PCNA family)
LYLKTKGELMKTNRKELVAILSAINCALSTKEVVENATCFIFSNGKVLTYNDEVAISHPVTLDLEGAIKGKEFLALLTKMTDEEVELVVQENTDGKPSRLLVSGVKTQAGIRLEANCNIDEILGMLGEPSDWMALPETFQPSIDFCGFSVGKDMNKPLLTTIYCGSNFTLSSDGNRITVCDLGDAVELVPFCLPSNSAKELKAFLPVEYAFTEGWIHFRTKDNVMFSSRLMMGDYPAEKARSIAMGATGATGAAVKLPNGLIDTLDRTGIFTSVGSTDRVQVKLADGLLTVRGEGESGWCQEEARVRYHGDAVEFEVAPEFLKQILQHTTETVIGSNLLSFSGLGFTHVMAVKLPSKELS